MAEDNKPTQLSLFPTRNSLEEVVQEGIAALPIETPNDLVALLHLHQNTLIKLTGDHTDGRNHPQLFDHWKIVKEVTL